MRTVSLDLSDPKSVQNALKELERFEKFIKQRVPVFIQRLADEGVEIANVRFGQAQYDGTNDVSVTYEVIDDKSTAVVALGFATLFIEFGTGVLNPGHPDPAAQAFPHGGYGKGLGKLSSWRYQGDPGTHGEPDPNHPGWVKTAGNPANMSMYLTVEELRRMFRQIAEEVFNYD